MKHNPPKTKCQYFSFSEAILITVVLIISFVISIPVLTTAADNASKTVCNANMQKIGAAFAAYGKDNDDSVAPNYLLKNKQAHFWHDLIFQYVGKNPSVFLCPAQNPLKQKFISHPTPFPASYATSNYVGGHDRLLKHYPYRKIKEYPNPSMQLLALDATGNDGKSWFYSIAWWNIPRKNEELGTKMMKKVHGDTVSVLLLDGHTDEASWSDLNPDIPDHLYSWNLAQNKNL